MFRNILFERSALNLLHSWTLTMVLSIHITLSNSSKNKNLISSLVLVVVSQTKLWGRMGRIKWPLETNGQHTVRLCERIQFWGANKHGEWNRVLSLQIVISSRAYWWIVGSFRLLFFLRRNRFPLARKCWFRYGLNCYWH